ncbi:MAG: thioesterase family protein [Acidimicrobiales bacterium]|nr:thioesterase family protein [Acidimicrobiales bacterium]MCB9394750.1 thioesterase family protein [Acidimicrobiaceae bacterium]
MDTRTFLGVQQSHNPFRWSMEVTPGISTTGGFLFGGSGLGAAITALEGTSGRQTIWATAQYLSYAKPGEILDIDVTIAVEGHQMTQARAVCHVGNREILTVNAALGHRPLEAAGQWEQMPDVPSPDECGVRTHRHPVDGTINDRLEQRLAKGRDWETIDGTPGDGQTLMWARIPDVIEGVDAAALAVLGDFVPMGVGQALGVRGGGNSLDNTLRLVHLVPTEWVLLDIRVHAVERGFGHGLVHMFAEDGTLLATASQSCIVRFWKG